MAALLSIVVVNYNFERYLAEAIDSALAQSVDCEVIVVDDCSTDGSRAVIEGYGSRITTAFHPTNRGSSSTVNSGFLLTTAPIVMFLDSDDYLHPHAASTVLAAWSSDVAQVQSRLDVVDERGHVVGVYPPHEVAMDAEGAVDDLLTRGRASTTVTSGLAYARTVLERVMPVPVEMFPRAADGYLVTVAPLHGRVVTIEDPIGAYRRHGESQSRMQDDLARRARWRVDHDECRYAILREHAGRLGLSVADDVGLQDLKHVEERLTSLVFEPDEHPYRQDHRVRLGLVGVRVTLQAPMSLALRSTHAAVLLVTALAPLPVARRALAWKLERTKRPAWVDWTARRLRRLLG